jgi:hypothetical protein
LQERGIEVLALDVSPGAIEVCRRRGVSQTYLGTVTDLAAASRSRFSTFIAMGNNLALLASRDYAPEFLGALKTLSMPGAVLAGTVIDPYGTIDPLHLRYHEENRRLGRFPGQIRLRHRWRNLADPWFDYLFVSPAELKSLVEPLGWEVVDFKYAGPIYLAELRSV